MVKNVVAVLTIIAIGVWLAGSPVAAQQSRGAVVDVPRSPNAEQLARGRYMVVTGDCNVCHTVNYDTLEGKVPENEWLTGGNVGRRGPWGTTYPTNLRINVSAMTEADWVAYAKELRTRPGMPAWSLRETSVEDLRAMYQFIKSLGAPGKPARPFLPPGQEPETPYVQVVAAGPPKPLAPLPPSTAGNVQRNAGANAATSRSGPDAEILALGRYMVLTGHCNNCHTRDYGRLEGKVAEKEWLMGNLQGHRGPWGTTYPTNLRIEVSKMTEAQWIAYVKNLRTRPPMPWWTLHERNIDDLRAIYQFIKTLGTPGEPAPSFLPPDQQPKPPYIQWPAAISAQ